MATTRTVKKSKGGVQDLLLGKGTQNQDRAGGTYAIDKLDIPVTTDTVAEMQALDVEDFTRARVYSDTATFEDYIYDAADITGVSSDTGNGTWHKVVPEGTEAELTTGTEVKQRWWSPRTLAHWVVQLFIRNVNTIADLRNLEPLIDGQQLSLLGHTNPGLGGGTFYYDASDTTSADNNGTTIVTAGAKRWKRIAVGYVTPEMFGCVDGATLPAAMVAVQLEFGDSGINVRFTLETYNNIAADVRVTQSHVTLIGSGRRTKLTFDDGFGLKLGTAILTDPDKDGVGSHKIVNTTISDMQLSCVTDYTGDILTIEFADSTTLRNVISGPVNTTSGSSSLATGIKIIWAQWVYGYSCQFGGNYAALFIDMTDHNKDNEDHFHFYGTTFYIQKHLRAGIPNASVYVRFKNGRGNGASEVSFDGCHIGQFAVGGADITNNYGLVVDLDGNSGDKTPMQGWMFNSTMWEACGTMIDLETLNVGNGAVIGTNTYNNCYFVGNAFTTQKMVVGRVFKASMVITSCTITSIVLLFTDILVRWVGNSNVINNTTFTNNGSITGHSFDGWRPCSFIRSSRVLTQTLNAAATSLVVAHGLGGTPKIINVNKLFMANHTITNVGSTNFTFTVDVAPVGNEVITFDMHVQSST